MVTKLSQSELEMMFDKNTLHKKLQNNILKIDSIKQSLDTIEDFKDTALFIMAQMLIFKTCKITTILGMILNTDTSISEMLDLILTMSKLDLIDIDLEGGIYSVLEPDSEELDWINNAMYPLPHITEPKEVHNNWESPYLTYNNNTILGSTQNRHDKDICLDHINRVNKIPLQINISMLNVAKNKWKTSDTNRDTQRSLKEFTKKEQDVINSMIVLGNKFYLSHGYDKRGRTYSRGYYISPMGNEYQKSLIELYNGEIIND
jgi:hypothetical protein